MEQVVLYKYGVCNVLPYLVVKDDFQYHYCDNVADINSGMYWDVVSDDEGDYYATHIC